jgi:hypothetical protein
MRRRGGGELTAANDAEWEISLKVPAGRVEDIFRAFTEDEKILAVQNVLQSRMDAALAPAEG